MDINARNLNQTAVYWGNPVTDGYGGFTFDSGVEIDCRWLNKMKLIINARGEEIVSRALVRVESDVEVGGYLFLGGIEDLSNSAAESDPFQEPDAYEIKVFTKIPSVKGDWFSRKAWL